MAHAMASPMASMMGLLMNGRNPLTMAFWITVMSVVRRVTSEEASKSSRFEKEKPWMCSYSASRRAAPRPMAKSAERRE